MYATKLIPKNLGLVKRLITEVSPSKFIFHLTNNIKSDMFNDKVKNVITPNAIYIDPTYKCNRACLGCYVDQSNTFISREIADEVADYAERNNVNYVAWLGGEPLLKEVRNTMLDVVKDYSKVAFNFCTNGDFLDYVIANKISKRNNLTPFLSVDGLEANHDFRRGKGSYKSVIKALALLKERHLMFGYMTTAMPHNKNEVVSDKFIETMIDKGCLIGGYAAYFCSDQTKESLPQEDYLKFISELRRIGSSFPLYILSTDFGYLGKDTILSKSKKLIAISVGPRGEIKTERGTEPIATIGINGTLDEIISSNIVQERFKEKLEGTGGSQRDNRLRLIQNL